MEVAHKLKLWQRHLLPDGLTDLHDEGVETLLAVDWLRLYHWIDRHGAVVVLVLTEDVVVDVEIEVEFRDVRPTVDVPRAHHLVVVGASSVKRMRLHAVGLEEEAERLRQVGHVDQVLLLA